MRTLAKLTVLALAVYGAYRMYEELVHDLNVLFPEAPEYDPDMEIVYGLRGDGS